MDATAVLKLWGKTCREDASRYHPLLFHMLDVAHAAAALWDLWLPVRIKDRIAVALGLEGEQARRAVVLLSGLHDLGKACAAFQRRAEEAFARLGLPDVVLSARAPLHGFVTTKELQQRYMQPGLGWIAGRDAAYCLAAISGGHHGVFPTSHLLDGTDYRLPDAQHEQEWAAARDALVKEFVRLAPSGGSAPPDLRTDALTDPGAVPLLAGFISVADWIGSAEEIFQPAARLDQPPPDADAYARQLPGRAKEALEAFGWLPLPTAAAPASINRVFRYVKSRVRFGRGDRFCYVKRFRANRMQQAVARIAEAQTEPLLLIVEEAMGRGKSEAALYVFDRAFAAGRTHGLYVALPTMATGNAMFARVREYLKERGHGGRLNLQLIHSGAVLNDEFRELLLSPVNPDGQGDAGTVAAASWFTARKRPLLAPFGAGTIDQSLLGVLQTRHWFVRLFGLAGKVVVFDEVHSYDAYMLTELHLLLRWLKELDCTVIILSATLPPVQRDELIRAWGAEPPAKPAPYPRVTRVAGGDCRDEHVGESSKLDRTVNLDFRCAAPESMLDLVQERLPGGGCGVIICNTVDRAQAVFRAVREPLEQAGWKVLLHHARTPLVWREEREKEVRDLLGKEGDRSRPTLVIGTQVLEQSLDYDADWMASDIAPVDLLLQRMGRLWRHLRKFRPVEAPRFDVLVDMPDDREHVPSLANAPEVIYARYRVLRSWLAIRDSDVVRLPSEIECLVKAVYTDAEPAGLPEVWYRHLEEKRQKMERDAARSVAKLCGGDTADRSCLAPAPVANGKPRQPKRILNAWNRQLDDDEDPTLHETVRALTRDARPSIQVICLGDDEDGRPLASPAVGRVSLDEARGLLKYGLTIQNQALFDALIAREGPANWQQSAHLRFARPLEFTRGRCAIEGILLRINRREGLVIERSTNS